MTLQQLEYIVALDNYRHYVTAAEKCFVSQPNLTMQVKKLEDEIGVKIFDRDNKPMKPTPTGEQIILKARQILREVEQLKAFLSDEKENLNGNFTVGIIPTLAPYLLPMFLPTFTNNNPGTHLIIKEMQTEQIISELNKGTVDIGLVVTPLDEKSIREIALFHEPFLLYLPLNHPLINKKDLRPDQLDPNELLLLKEGHCFRNQALNICGSSTDRSNSNFEYESGSIETLKGLVKQGAGYTLVPESSVLNEADSGFTKRFKKPEPVREVSLIVHNNFTREALIERLHESILQSIPERFKKIRRFMRVKWR